MEPANWWEQHFGELISAEQAMILRHEGRAQVLAGLGGATLGWSLTQLQHMYGFAWLFQVISLMVLVFATAALGLVAWPMERGAFEEGSLEERAWKALSGQRVRWAALLGVVESPEARLSANVAEQTRKDGFETTESLKSAGARRLLVEFLKQAVYADLGWWLAEEDPRVAAVRLRLVFRWWGLRQAAYVKMMLVKVGMRALLLGLLLLASAVGLESLGLWVTLPFLGLAGMWIRHRLDFS